MLKHHRKILITLSFAVSVVTTTSTFAAGTACLQFPISASDWNTKGKSGGACRIASPYGWRQLTPGVSTFHGGMDFSCKEGTPVLAPVDGTLYHESFADGGNHVVRISAPGIDSRLGAQYKVSLLHNSKWATDNAVPVKPGDVVAYLGNEGHSTGAHVHLQVTMVGSLKSAIDPNALSCGGWPAGGPMDETTEPSAPANGPTNSDATSGAKVFGKVNPNETPPRVPGGLDEESKTGDLANDIMLRAFNPEYIKQLGTLSSVSLFRELNNIDAIDARLGLLKMKSDERKSALSAAILSLRARGLRPNLEKQKQKAIASGNTFGK